MVLAKVIVRTVLKDESKTIVSEPAAAFALKIACRKLPAPLLFVFVTVNVAEKLFTVKIVKIEIVVIKNLKMYVEIYCIFSPLLETAEISVSECQLAIHIDRR